MGAIVNIEITKMEFRVKHLANRLMLSPSNLIAMLNSHGFNVSRNSNILLNEEHIEAIGKSYRASLHNLFKRVKRRLRKGKGNPDNYRSYFSYFVKDGDTIEVFNSNIECWELDDKLIDDAFYALIYCVKIRRDRGSKFFKDVRRNFCSKLGLIALITKRSLKSIISPHLFFIYSDDEDGHPLANSYYGFGTATVVTLEALVNHFIDSFRVKIHEQHIIFN